MSAYTIIVNDVQKMKNKILCLARIDNYRNVLKHVTVGESIRTDPFRLDFYDSVGTSSWMLIFYPKGQYVESRNSVVKESGRASMYLKMVDCEHQDDSLGLAIRFFIKSPYCDVLDKFSTSKCANFSYRNLSERWSGPFNLAAIEELYSSRCKNLFLNDSLTVGCELDDTTFHPSPMMHLNENVHVTDTSYTTDDERSLTIGYELGNTSFRPCTTYTDDQRSLNVGFQLGDTTFRLPSMMEWEENVHGTSASYSYDQHSSAVGPQLNSTTFYPYTPPSMMQSKENVHSTGKSYTDQRRSLIFGSVLDKRPRTPRTTLQPRENFNISSRSHTAGRHSLPVGYEPHNTTLPVSSIDAKLDTVKKPVKKSTNIGPRQTTPRVHTKGNPRRESTFNTDVKADECKGEKNEKKISVQELTSAHRNVSLEENEKEHDSFKENEKQSLCACRNSNEMISKETQTWSDKLRSCGKVDKNGTDNVHQLSPRHHRVKSRVAYFEKAFSSKD
ncbi:uncharacterized protein LOC119072232 isoform X3 [Bradysia coprophila]|uniref:uncharacterized protein LOC119072232 isoform X3 n=1 Tax=Bradysia coprophila TaxID=38358 RepID=UPI00187D84CE|nr:uncharacterized protein LOC119072232 isoform X3 [Bradysia coprophila]